MKKNKGFTLVEIFLVLALLFILVSIILTIIGSYMRSNDEEFIAHQKIYKGSEERCIVGYKHLVHGRTTTQIINSDGAGITCE